MITRESVLRQFALFSFPDNGIGSWLSNDTPDEVFDRLAIIENNPLSKIQLNQLLAFAHEAPLSDGFFQYYWLNCPATHPYDVTNLPDYSERSNSSRAIYSLSHLAWGLYRLYVDGLLWFGNVRTAYRSLRTQDYSSICEHFSIRRYDTEALKRRGPVLTLSSIRKDDRYLISEMACKSYGDNPTTRSELRDALIESFRIHARGSGGAITIRKLLENHIPKSLKERQTEFMFSVDDVLEETVKTEEEIFAKYTQVADRFFAARQSALRNTNLYLSMVGELDVYVATSMRTRHDFRNMANTCEKIFLSEKLQEFQLRNFDPTISAAEGHEDKGLIECLMVKCAKVLVYCAGEKESYGKDAEAAMALSLGKPVVFFCDEERRSRFYRDVHPLSRLIEFETGIAVGAMVTSSIEQVTELLYRVLANKMEYRLEQSKPGYLRLKETLTESVVRLQTNDRMLSETFWNCYHNK